MWYRPARLMLKERHMMRKNNHENFPGEVGLDIFQEIIGEDRAI